VESARETGGFIYVMPALFDNNLKLFWDLILYFYFQCPKFQWMNSRQVDFQLANRSIRIVMGFLSILTCGL
jgi:hypothetical protein